ncbi:MAG: hypothetical protein PHC61_08110 [Chitinivibrionales bacterium]|nr:hypothetical protein [Chitinivibrionales bacterium]
MVKDNFAGDQNEYLHNLEFSGPYLEILQKIISVADINVTRPDEVKKSIAVFNEFSRFTVDFVNWHLNYYPCSEGLDIFYEDGITLVLFFDKMLAIMKETEGVDFVKCETCYNFCFFLALFWIGSFMHSYYQRKTERGFFIELLRKLEEDVLNGFP